MTREAEPTPTTPDPPVARRLHINRRGLAIAALVVLAAVLFASMASLQRVFFDSVGVIAEELSHHPVLGATLFVVLAAASSLLSVFSSVPLVPIATVLWGPLTTFLLLLSGWLLGGACAYGLARWVGAHLLQRLMSLNQVVRYQRLLERRTSFGLVLLFRLAMPAELPGYVLGFLRYSFPLFLLATLLSELPFALLAVYAGDAFVSAQPIRVVASVALGAAALSLLFHELHKRLGEDPDPPPPST